MGSQKLAKKRICYEHIYSKRPFFRINTVWIVSYIMVFLCSLCTDKLLENIGQVIVDELQNSKAEQLRYKITLASAFFFKFYKGLSKLLKVQLKYR